MGTTTPWGFPWPESSERVNTGDDALRALAEAYEEKAIVHVTDPAEAGLTVGADWSFTSFLLNRYGPLISLRFTADYTGATVTGTATGNIGDLTIAEGLLPEWTPLITAVGVYHRNGVSFGNWGVTTGDALQLQTLHATATISNGDAIGASVTYPIGTTP